MSVALFSAGVANPRKEKKQKVWTLWFRVRVQTRSSDIRGEWKPEEGEALLVGSKEPCAVRRKRRPFRRGKRSRRGGARHVRRCKHPVRPLPSEKASRKERGSAARTAHFVSAFERSAGRLVKASQQCLDIKSRATQRQRIGRDPLPPKAKAGLDRRQTSIRHASAFWGDAYAKVFGCSRLAGRRCWRDLLRRLADVREMDDTSVWGDSSSVAESAAVAEEDPIGPDGIENRSAEAIIAYWESGGRGGGRNDQRRGPPLCSSCGRPCFSATGRHKSCRSRDVRLRRT
jgi:hypothetical protein